jgi:hypothetical protein
VKGIGLPNFKVESGSDTKVAIWVNYMWNSLFANKYKQTSGSSNSPDASAPSVAPDLLQNHCELHSDLLRVPKSLLPTFYKLVF